MKHTQTFQTQNEPFRQLIGNGTSFEVPRFQRDYSWEDTQWDDLWVDLVETIRDGGEPSHYMGYLVLQAISENQRLVIDGQQRLTTISLVILAGLKHLRALISAGDGIDSNQLRFDQIQRTYIGYLDPVTLNVRPKLSLNRNNNSYFQNHLVELPEVLPTQRFNSSELLMRKAFLWFEKKFGEYLSTKEDKGKEIALFIDRLSTRLFFTVITVTNELNAYRVFETLNARGVRLSSTDLLKNYLFSVLSRENVADDELDRLDDRWAELVDRLGNEKFPTYLRVHWNSRNAGRVREADLFKVVRNSVGDRAAVFKLLREMEEDLETYLELTTSAVSGLTPTLTESIEQLKLFRVRQVESLLLAAKRHLTESDYERVIRSIVIVSFRYNVISSMATGDQETLYGQIVRKLLTKEIVSATDLIAHLRAVYPSDEVFSRNFAERTFKARGAAVRLVRYILAKLETAMGGTPLDWKTDSATIEHILPQNPDIAEWPGIEQRDLDLFVIRLGNLTLLEKPKNADASSSSFEIKKEVYGTSDFLMTREIPEKYEEWSFEAIHSRQVQLSRSAQNIWRLSQLS